MKIAYLPRQALVTVNSLAVNSGQDFGAFPITSYSRITGLASGVGSMSIRLRTGMAQAGPFITTSTWIVNSGISVLDAPNYGSWLAVDITATNTTVPNPVFAIYGEPVR